MLSTINTSVRCFCKEILGLAINRRNTHPQEFFGASIPLSYNDTEAHYYLFFKPDDIFHLGTPEFLGQISSPSPLKLEGFLLDELESGLFLVEKGI